MRWFFSICWFKNFLFAHTFFNAHPLSIKLLFHGCAFIAIPGKGVRILSAKIWFSFAPLLRIYPLRFVCPIQLTVLELCICPIFGSGTPQWFDRFLTNMTSVVFTVVSPSSFACIVRLRVMGICWFSFFKVDVLHTLW